MRFLVTSARLLCVYLSPCLISENCEDGRDAMGVQATADQIAKLERELVKVAHDRSAELMQNAPVVADIDKYTKCV